MLLKDEANGFLSPRGQFCFSCSEDVSSAQSHRTLCRPFQTAEHKQQRAFARARRAGDRQRVTASQ